MRTRQFTLKAYSAALVTLLLGALLSMELGDWNWLARSGSLVVVNGIILTSHQIIDHMQQLGRQQRRDSMVNRDWGGDARHHLLQESDERRWLSEKNGLYMLIIGTLVWGFGDLLNLL
ncbi:MAG: hypothetical protein OEZ16_05785 [Chromatiales bacterium]|nr:hypothetical protein [Chromatiales bacterium]